MSQTNSIHKGITAAYNFVPLNERILLPDWAKQVSHDVPFTEGISGVLQLKIHTLTPLLVGSGQPREHKEPVQPYRLPDGRCAIAGNSLRGMIRNVLQIASFGRMQEVDDVQLSFRDLHNKKDYLDAFSSSQARKSKAAWLKYTEQGWQLLPCAYAQVEQKQLQCCFLKGKQKLGAKDQTADIKYDMLGGAQTVWFSLKTERNIHKTQDSTDYLGKVEHLAKHKRTDCQHQGITVVTGQPSDSKNDKAKHTEFLFSVSTTESIELAPKLMQQFLQDHHSQSNQTNNNNGRANTWDYWYKQLKDPSSAIGTGKIPGIPVFWLPDANNPNHVKHLGLSQMFRLPYANSLGQALDNSNPLHRATDTNAYDLCDLMFGTIRPESEHSLKGRVSFSLGLLEGQENLLPVSEATVLSSPKPNYYPAYIQQTEQKAGQLVISSKNKHGKPEYVYHTLNHPNAKLRGYKRYPIRPPEQVKVAPLPDKVTPDSKVTVRLQPLAQGHNFTARIRIHNLLPLELGALLWALEGDTENPLTHSLGMGKAFGYGQVNVKIIDSKLLCNHPDKTASKLEEYRNVFIEWMNQFCQKQFHQNWHETPQLEALLSMMDANKTKNHCLEPMALEQFRNSIKQGLTLAQYNDKKSIVKVTTSSHQTLKDQTHKLNLSDWQRKKQTEQATKERIQQQEEALTLADESLRPLLQLSLEWEQALANHRSDRQQKIHDDVLHLSKSLKKNNMEDNLAYRQTLQTLMKKTHQVMGYPKGKKGKERKAFIQSLFTET